MRNIAGKITRVIDLLSSSCMYLSAAILILMMLLITVEVFGRYLFKFSTLLSDEMSGYMLVAFTFLGITYALRTGSLLRMEFIYNRLPLRMRNFIQLGFDIVALAFSITLFNVFYRLVLSSYKTNALSLSIFHTPLYLPEMAMPVGMAILCLGLLAEIIRDIGVSWGRWPVE